MTTFDTVPLLSLAPPEARASAKAAACQAQMRERRQSLICPRLEDPGRVNGNSPRNISEHHGELRVQLIKCVETRPVDALVL